MNHRVGPFEERPDGFVGNVLLHDMARKACDAGRGIRVYLVDQSVQSDHLMATAGQLTGKMKADEPSSSGDQYLHTARILCAVLMASTVHQSLTKSSMPRGRAAGRALGGKVLPRGRVDDHVRAGISVCGLGHAQSATGVVGEPGHNVNFIATTGKAAPDDARHWGRRQETGNSMCVTSFLTDD